MRKRKLYLFGFISTFLSLIVLITSLNAKETNKKDMFRFDSLIKFSKVIGVIENYYVEELKFDDIVNKAISGLVENLDAHSSYMFEDELKDMRIKTKGEFGGLGITVGMRDGVLTVISPIEGTPADKAGVKAKDIILKIDNHSTIDMKLDEAVKLMRGKPGTKITLTIVREGESKPLKINIIRDIIKVDSVYAKDFEDHKGILYIRVTSFDEKVTKDVREAINKKKNLKGIILDLRNNPGGLLSQAIGLTDIFVSKGVIVSQKGRIKKDIKVYKAHSKNTIKVPLVVLVNEGSASASEIVSGALQDHHRAIIIGKKTFGKGSVQSIIPINKKEAIRLTIARYYLPSGRTIQAKGVEPDITVCGCKVPSSKENALSLKEKDLKRHLRVELAKVDGNTTKEDNNSSMATDEKVKIITKEMILKDMQLKSALDTLKILQLERKM